MTSVSHYQIVTTLLAAIGLCIPAPLLAAEPSPQLPQVVDVKLLEGGVLLGQVVDLQGIAAQEAPVAILANNQVLATSQTRSDGYFAFRNLRGGVYQLTTTDGQGVYRLWAPGSAPPSAQDGALLVAGSNTVRGQTYITNGFFPRLTGGPVGFWLSHPLVIGGLVATAVAVPVILHNRDKDSPVSP